ncbi:hypothetical protein GWI33_004897 [Rhynchophorus ferrugineus]|uniref:SWIM-type domain-containing protein n=1 Tax=Rhynchophorus ferrugineus TaxID=354439 RepID=A0A834ME89_RHYFE|nr:hypothetical protein GWI33_004897 [Rhynchophorus ferrugineus]
MKDIVSESRGFVQLPLLQSTHEDNSILSDAALCFVDSCQRSFDNSILKCHEEITETAESEVCDHINMALKSETVATPIVVNPYVISSLKVSNEVQQTLNLFAVESGCPLVQRVSKNVMAVKCQVTSKQPLGYLHFTITKGKYKGYEKYSCDCTEYVFSASNFHQSNIRHKCIHYYACIAALLSDSSYSEEYSHFINNEMNPKNKTFNISSNKIVKHIDLVEIKPAKINISSNILIKKPTLQKREKVRAATKKQKISIQRCKKIVPKIYPIEIKVLDELPLTQNVDNGVSWQFLDWLAFVTESINKTMQFINCGNINTQVFYIPEIFWWELKKRIPTMYTEQKTTMGSVFYSIMNINHIKDIFDSPKVKIRIAKKLVHDERSGYVEYDESNDTQEANAEYQMSFIFFLNVGPSTVDESDDQNNSFIVEWLPNICSTVQMGQLKLQYKYGRKSI